MFLFFFNFLFTTSLFMAMSIPSEKLQLPGFALSCGRCLSFLAFFYKYFAPKGAIPTFMLSLSLPPFLGEREGGSYVSSLMASIGL
ncbi:MAG: hypothetical protein Q8M67_01495, partial [Bacteroidota bacterium]|nr:hypothetical protein [Bacteroidota bacterium]